MSILDLKRSSELFVVHFVFFLSFSFRKSIEFKSRLISDRNFFMANTDVLDILSDTLTPTNRTSTNKDEIIREKVRQKWIKSVINFRFNFNRKKAQRRLFVDQKE